MKFIPSVLKLLLLLYVLTSNSAVAGPISFDNIKSNWGSVLGGAVTTVAIHELGHFTVAEIEDANAYFDGATVRYRDSDGSDRQNLRLSSAGFQMQWLVSEYAFGRLKQTDLSDQSRAWNAGLVLGHIGISLTYLTILRNNKDGDAAGIADAHDTSTGKVVALLALPAILDSWRLFGEASPKWTSWASRGTKLIGIAAVWEF